MNTRLTCAVWTLLVAGLAVAGEPATETPAEPATETSWLDWPALPALPDREGFAGMFAGTSDGALIVAGGANFPDKRPWAGGRKIWYDSIFVLRQPDGQWQMAEEKLSRPLAYGVSVSFDGGVICIGGANSVLRPENERVECPSDDDPKAYRQVHYRDVFMLRWKEGRIETESLPSLPRACAFACGALVDKTIYIAGGLDRPESETAEAQHAFWAMDLSRPKDQRRWESLEPWPGAGRFQSVAGVWDGKFLLFGGIRLEKDSEGKPRRASPHLTDAYRFTPARGGEPAQWDRIADLPHPASAAPSPAMALGQSHLMVLGGADGLWSGTDLNEHPGFSHEIQAYHGITDQWLARGKLPQGTSRVTAPTVSWRGRYVVVSGERRPGVRSPDVFSAVPAPREATFGIANWSVLAIYLAALMAMGVYFSRREKSTEDFFLGGRRIPWWAAGLSIYGTQLSAITFMAIPAIAYADNMVRLIGNWTIFVVAPLVVFCYLPFFRRLNVATAYEYLEHRFNVAVRLFASTAFILLQLGRMGIVLYLPAIALSGVTGINVYLCIGLMGVLCTIYTVLGGIEAVIWTDVLQVIVLLCGAVMCLGVIGYQVGGFDRILTIAAEHGKTTVFQWGWSASHTTVWVMVVGNLVLSLIPYTTDQTVVQRYLTTRNEKEAAKSIWTNAILCVPTGFLFFFLGAALFVFYKLNPAWIEPGANDQILPVFIVQQLPAGLAGLVIAGVFAAAMSSLDSSMNSIAAAYVTDFHRRFKPEVSDHSCLVLARWLTVLIGVVGTGSAALIASCGIRSLFDHFNMLLGLCGGGLAGIFILAVFTRRATARGVLIGAIVGAASPLVVKYTTSINPFLYGAIGVGACVLVGYTCSLWLPDREKDLDGLTVHTMPARD